MAYCWLVEGRWVEGPDKEWGVILDRGPYPNRKEARSEARFLASRAGGGHLYRATKYVRAKPARATKGRKLR